MEEQRRRAAVVRGGSPGQGVPRREWTKLSTAGGRLLDRILALGQHFTIEDVVGSGASAVVRESAAFLIEFLCEVGVLHATERDGTYPHRSGDAVAGTVSCVVCTGEWPIGSRALTALPRSICLAPSFLVVFRTLKVVGICACRASS
jgi:hypothetical protein